MRNLLKADMIRFLKSKQFLVLSIILGIYSIGYPILVYFIQEMANMVSNSSEPINMLYAKQLTFSHFSLGIPLLLTIILFTTILNNEFSCGAIRNKIISGYSRTQVFLSLFITMFVFMFGIVFIASLLSFIVGGILLYYDAQGRTFIDDIGSYLIALFVSMCIMSVYTSIICLFVIGLNKTPLGIIFPIIFIFLAIIVSAMCDTFIEILVQKGSNSNFIDVLTFLQCINIYYQTSKLTELSFQYYEVLAFIFAPLLFSSLLVFLGMFSFKRRDLK